MSDTVIKFNSVSKSYNIRERGYRSFRDGVTNWIKRKAHSAKRKTNNPLLPAPCSLPSSQGDDLLWALKDVSFEVEKGKALGIIGANGSGKTTTLRLLSKVTAPTEGNIDVSGKIAPLIQVGAGFHPELTGRENVYLNAAIMGLTKNDIDEKYDDIVSFAELDGFMDTPVKRYSSGMYVRLGFAVVANIDPDIFLIDEILSVGDLSFQRKCLDTMSRIRKSDKAVVFVSHNLFAVNGLCDRVIWLDKGEIQKEGDPGEVISAYRAFMTSKSEFVHDISHTGGQTRWGTGEVRFTDVKITDGENRERQKFRAGEQLSIEATYESHQIIESPVFWFGILDSEERWVTGFVLNNVSSAEKMVLDGKGFVKCGFEARYFYPGTYYIVMGIFPDIEINAYDRIGNACEFEIIDDAHKIIGYRPPHWKGVINLPHRWEHKPLKIKKDGIEI